MFFNYSDKLCSDRFFIKESDVHAWCKAMGIIKYRYAYSDFHKAMALSVKDSVRLAGKLNKLSQLPVRFDKLEANLWLEHNQLTSLVGLPQTCKTIAIDNNPLSFESLMPLSHVKELKLIYLPINFKKEVEAKGVEFLQEPDYLVLEKEATINFQSHLTSIVQQKQQKQQNEKALQQNQSFLLALNQVFQHKTLFNRKNKG